MTAVGIAGCALLGLVVGVVVNLAIDRIPSQRALLPATSGRRRCRNAVPADASDGGVEGEAGHEEKLEDGHHAHRDEGVDSGPGRKHGAPALSWPLVRRRCPVCGQRAALRYPLVELACGGLFAAAAARFGDDWALPAYLVFFTCLLAISVIDLEHHIIPNRIVYPTIFAAVPLLAVAAAVQNEWDRFGHALLGATLAWTSLLLIHLVSPGGMGFGDVRLSFVLGLFLGWLGLRFVLTGLFMGFLLGSVLGVSLVALRLRTRKDHIPFGPFLAAGAAVTVFAGAPINRWWLGG